MGKWSVQKMINFKTILRGVEKVLRDNLTGYTITRNEPRNQDPDTAAKGSGWIGIYRGKLGYSSYAIGGTPWMVEVETKIEIQCASMASGEDAEDRLQDAETEVLTVLNANKKLNNTVDMTNGYDIEYEYNDLEEVYHHAAIITLKSEARA